MIIPPYPPTPRFQWSLGVILRPVNYDPLLLFRVLFALLTLEYLAKSAQKSSFYE